MKTIVLLGVLAAPLPHCPLGFAAEPAKPTIAALTPVKARHAAPAFALKDLFGESVRLSDYRGKVVLLNFWATWCGGCKEELPWFREFQRTFGPKQFAALGVAMDEEGAKVVVPLVQKLDPNFTTLYYDDATVKSFGLETLPVTLLVDRKGRIAAAYRGLVDRGNIERNLRALLKQ